MKIVKAKTVAEYLRAQPPKNRAALERIRKVIRSVVPKAAEEVISYGMPAYRYGKGWPIIYFAGFTNHLSIFPGNGTTINKFAKELKDFKTTRGTVQFTAEHPIPSALIKKIIKVRLAEKDAEVYPKN